MSEYIISGDRTDTRDGSMYRVYWIGANGKSGWVTESRRAHLYADIKRALDAVKRNGLAAPSWCGHWTVEISVWTIEMEATDYAENCKPNGKFPDRRGE
jgi:hypothetical protein